MWTIFKVFIEFITILHLFIFIFIYYWIFDQEASWSKRCDLSSLIRN